MAINRSRLRDALLRKIGENDVFEYIAIVSATAVPVLDCNLPVEHFAD